MITDGQTHAHACTHASTHAHTHTHTHIDRHAHHNTLCSSIGDGVISAFGESYWLEYNTRKLSDR